MNKICFAGRLAADAEVRFSPNGDPVASFRVASDVGYGDKKTTNWFSCQIWGKRGESLAPHMAKGAQVTVWGTLTLRPWNDKNGVEKISADIRVDEIALQGGKSDAQQSKQATKKQESFDDSDIPF